MEQPLVELFVKASGVNWNDKGACPFSQKWFMVFYRLVECRMINLRVIPVSMANPPSEYSRLDMGKQLPSIAFYSKPNDDENAYDPPDFVCDGNDELEEFLRSKYGSVMNIDAQEQWVGADLLRSLNHFLRTGSSQQVLTNFSSVNEHLRKTNTTFLEGDDFAYSDCVLACKLHHARIAASFFRGLSIPSKFSHLWSYMKAVYATRAFTVSCPLDRDILLHYLEKVDFVSTEARNEAHHEIITLPQDKMSTFIPGEDPEASAQMPRLTCSGLRLFVNSVMPTMEFDRSLPNRISRLFSVVK
ncbi:Chloride intracellular channel protein 5 [Echinococcus granulosus]|nr:Chloride intracellular channel protein 5 [Echinococcus granulosus]CDS21611.1 chloride intracellular channel exc 4 [Echinococcus granulosus]